MGCWNLENLLFLSSFEWENEHKMFFICQCSKIHACCICKSSSVKKKQTNKWRADGTPVLFTLFVRDEKWKTDYFWWWWFKGWNNGQQEQVFLVVVWFLSSWKKPSVFGYCIDKVLWFRFPKWKLKPLFYIYTFVNCWILGWSKN